MMDEERLTQIGEEFGKQVAELVGRAVVQAVTVQSVDDKYAYVSVFDGDAPYRVPLQMLNIGTTFLRIVPTVGSTALVFNANGNANTKCFVGFGSVDSVDVIVGESTLKVTSEEILLNGGTLGGLVVVGKLTERLNKLQDQINQIQTSITSHAHTVQVDATTHMGATTGTTYTTIALTRVSNDDYVNEKIKQ